MVRHESDKRCFCCCLRGARACFSRTIAILRHKQPFILVWFLFFVSFPINRVVYLLCSMFPFSLTQSLPFFLGLCVCSRLHCTRPLETWSLSSFANRFQRQLRTFWLIVHLGIMMGAKYTGKFVYARARVRVCVFVAVVVVVAVHSFLQ